ncbi:MAG TPA: methyltransferase domain-containing protein [Gaiellaceae bacterium]|nr:methyltransferase domain-containing protein [Gaiellaceae bacterium]
MKREELFDEDYLYFYEDVLSDERSDLAVDLVWRLLELEPGMEVLDLACGHGRIANRLAERGARVTGLDATPLFLERARADAERLGVDVEYVEGDMRELPWESRFDRIVNWFTAFGYFDDDEEDRRVLRAAHRALRPGGRLLIENNNLAELLGRWQPWVAVERDGDFTLDRSVFDPVSGRARTERVIVRDGRTRRTSFSVRMFVAVELRAWLRDAGFSSVESYDGDGEPLTAQGRRMITIARR